MLYCGPSASYKRTRPISSLLLWLNPQAGEIEAGPVFLLVNRAGKMKRVLCSY